MEPHPYSQHVTGACGINVAHNADDHDECGECGHLRLHHDCCPLRCSACGAAFIYHGFTTHELPRRRRAVR